MLSALNQIPRGAVIAGAKAEDPFAWDQPATAHVFSWATVRRDALTNGDFAIEGLHMLSHRDGDTAFLDPSQRVLIAEGEAANLAAFAPALRADYLWFTGDREPSALPPGAHVIARGNGWLIARLAKAPASR